MANSVDPVWQPTNVDEIAELTGDLPRTWMAGVYTSELIKATAELPLGRPEVIWDPAKARVAGAVSPRLSSWVWTTDSTDMVGIPVELSVVEAELAMTIAARASVGRP